MNISAKWELSGLLAISAISLTVVGLSMNSRTGTGEAASVTPLIAEAKADPVEKPVADKRVAKTNDTQTPIYLDLGARF